MEKDSDECEGVSEDFSNLFPGSLGEKGRVIILDGGMGTSLEAPPFSVNLDSTLWSSALLASKHGQRKLMGLHHLWIECGCDIISSCSYQSSVRLFQLESRQGSTQTPPNVNVSNVINQNVKELMTSTLELCMSTITSSRNPDCKVALSLGPLGAQLVPGQEYTGLYPAPFSSHPHLTKGVLPYKWTHESEERASPQTCLTSWHRERLADFCNAALFNEVVSLVAFETIPNIDEIKSIRQAANLCGLSKPFYISLVFPSNDTGNPQFPGLAHLDLNAQARVLIQSVLGPCEHGIRPSAIGINCTHPQHIFSISKALTCAAADLLEPSLSPPWLVLYPDGGSVYDVVTRTWSNPSGLDENEWAKIVAASTKTALGSVYGESKAHVWGGVIAGGCCKAGPGHIKALREIFPRYRSL